MRERHFDPKRKLEDSLSFGWLPVISASESKGGPFVLSPPCTLPSHSCDEEMAADFKIGAATLQTLNIPATLLLPLLCPEMSRKLFVQNLLLTLSVRSLISVIASDNLDLLYFTFLLFSSSPVMD